jgi:hypothetical protein
VVVWLCNNPYSNGFFLRATQSHVLAAVLLFQTAHGIRMQNMHILSALCMSAVYGGERHFASCR